MENLAEKLTQNLLKEMYKQLCSSFQTMITESVRTELSDLNNKLQQLEFIKKQLSMLNKQMTTITSEFEKFDTENIKMDITEKTSQREKEDLADKKLDCQMFNDILNGDYTKDDVVSCDNLCQDACDEDEEEEQEEASEAVNDGENEDEASEAVEEEEEEEDEEDEDGIEVEEVVIKGKTYFATNTQDGEIYSIDENGDPDEESIGMYIKGKVVWN